MNSARLACKASETELLAETKSNRAFTVRAMPLDLIRVTDWAHVKQMDRDIIVVMGLLGFIFMGTLVFFTTL